MFDPQMLMSMFGNMNNFSGGAQNANDNGANNFSSNPLMSMLGGNPNMLSGLMQMFNNNNQSNQSNQPTVGRNTYVNNKITNNQNINEELYHIIKNSENIF